MLQDGWSHVGYRLITADMFYPIGFEVLPHLALRWYQSGFSFEQLYCTILGL